MQEPLPDEPILSDSRAPGHRPRSSNRFQRLMLLSAAVLLAAVAFYAWRSTRPVAPTIEAPPPMAPAASAAAPAPPVPPSAPPAIVHPVEPEPAASAAALPPLDESDLELARLLEGAVGRSARAQLRTTGFVRNLVATVDNLPRNHAPAHVWPVNPTAGRFSVIEQGGQTVVSPDNELRYAPLVLMAESADIDRLVSLYRWAYPLFQQAYEELGYPGRYFNDRLVAVIDHLLAAPEPAPPLVVEAVKVEGPEQLARPWLHYVFADPALESLSAGQKIMVRVGLVHERRLKAQLTKLRAALTRKPAAP